VFKKHITSEAENYVLNPPGGKYVANKVAINNRHAMRAEPMTFCSAIWWNLWTQPMGFMPLLCGPLRLPRQLAANVTCLHQSKESTYSVIINQGDEERDYVTVNYSGTLELRATWIKLFLSLLFKDMSFRGLNLLTVYSTPDRREKKLAKFSRSPLECFVSCVRFRRCFKRCVAFRRFKLQAAVDYANLFNICFELQIIPSKVWYLVKILL